MGVCAAQWINLWWLTLQGRAVGCESGSDPGWGDTGWETFPGISTEQHRFPAPLAEIPGLCSLPVPFLRLLTRACCVPWDTRVLCDRRQSRTRPSRAVARRAGFELLLLFWGRRERAELQSQKKTILIQGEWNNLNSRTKVTFQMKSQRYKWEVQRGGRRGRGGRGSAVPGQLCQRTAKTPSSEYLQIHFNIQKQNPNPCSFTSCDGSSAWVPLVRRTS